MKNLFGCFFKTKKKKNVTIVDERTVVNPVGPDPGRLSQSTGSLNVKGVWTPATIKLETKI